MLYTPHTKLVATGKSSARSTQLCGMLARARCMWRPSIGCARGRMTKSTVGGNPFPGDPAPTDHRAFLAVFFVVLGSAYNLGWYLTRLESNMKKKISRVEHEKELRELNDIIENHKARTALLRAFAGLPCPSEGQQVHGG